MAGLEVRELSSLLARTSSPDAGWAEDEGFAASDRERDLGEERCGGSRLLLSVVLLLSSGGVDSGCSLPSQSCSLSLLSNGAAAEGWKVDVEVDGVPLAMAAGYSRTR